MSCPQLSKVEFYHAESFLNTLILRLAGPWSDWTHYLLVPLPTRLQVNWSLWVIQAAVANFSKESHYKGCAPKTLLGQ